MCIRDRIYETYLDKDMEADGTRYLEAVLSTEAKGAEDLCSRGCLLYTSYNGENRPENFAKRTPVAKPVEVVPPAELRPEETEQPRTGAASENRTEEGVSNAYNVPAETVQLDSGEKDVYKRQELQ